MAPVTGRLLFVSDDVFFWARVQAAAKAAGRDARRVGDDAAMEAALAEGGVSRVLFDLGVRAVDPAVWAARWKATSPAPELVAFGAHVDEAALSAARTAGFDRVMPNSRFQRELLDLVR